MEGSPGRQHIAVEYDPRVLDAVRAHVSGGFERTAPSGFETGGVLFGTHSRRKITVTAMRPAPCEYSSGPVYVLGPPDHQTFQQVVALHQTDPELNGMEPVGWFLSHVRDSLVLRPSDREIFDRYFEQAWQVVLVIRPGRVGSLRAATMARGPDDDMVLNEFTIRQVKEAESAAGETAPKVEPAPVPVTVVPSPEAVPPAPATVPARVESPRPRVASRPLLAQRPAMQVKVPLQLPAAPSPPPLPRRPEPTWPAWALASGLLVLAGLAATLYLNANSPDSVGLGAVERDGIMNIEWNPSSRIVSRADRAELDIIDGDLRSSRDLGKTDLQRGVFVVLRKNADLTARLRFYSTNGVIGQEVTKYVGRPVVKDDSGRKALDRLEKENAALRVQLARERQRAEELQKHVTTLHRIVRGRK